MAPKTVGEYIHKLPPAARRAMQQMRAAISSAVPRDTEEFISYGVPAFRRGRVLVWFAAFSAHCSLFPTASVVSAFKKELEGFTISKGTVRFPLDKPLPIALIKRIVKARVAQVESGQRERRRGTSARRRSSRR